MDLGTIKNRLLNRYYRNAKECILDINIMFSNCHVYFKPEDDIMNKEEQLEKLYYKKVRLI